MLNKPLPYCSSYDFRTRGSKTWGLNLVPDHAVYVFKQTTVVRLLIGSLIRKILKYRQHVGCVAAIPGSVIHFQVKIKILVSV